MHNLEFLLYIIWVSSLSDYSVILCVTYTWRILDLICIDKIALSLLGIRILLCNSYY